MHCIPTTEFLKRKLHNLRQALLQKHNASESQLLQQRHF